MVEVYWVQVIFLELYSFIHVKSESSRISVFINSSRFGLNVKFQSFWEVPILDLNKTTVPLCNASISGIRCPHRGAVFSYTSRHVDYPYTDGDREACNVFFVWEFLRPLIKGNYLLACLFHKLTVQRPSSSWSRTFNRRTLFLLITYVLVYVLIQSCINIIVFTNYTIFQEFLSTSYQVMWYTTPHCFVTSYHPIRLPECCSRPLYLRLY